MILKRFLSIGYHKFQPVIWTNGIIVVMNYYWFALVEMWSQKMYVNGQKLRNTRGRLDVQSEFECANRQTNSVMNNFKSAFLLLETFTKNASVWIAHWKIGSAQHWNSITNTTDIPITRLRHVKELPVNWIVIKYYLNSTVTHYGCHIRWTWIAIKYQLRQYYTKKHEKVAIWKFIKV